MNPPRVVMFCGQFWPKIGGAERQAQKLAMALIRKGCRVEILTPQLEKTWPHEEIIDGLRITRFPFVDLTRVFKGVRGFGMLNTLFMGAQVRRAVQRHIQDYDVVQMHIAWVLADYATAVAHAARKKVFCTIASGGRTFDLILSRSTSRLGPKLTNSLIHSMDRWIAISHEIQADLQAAGVLPERIVRIPNGVEIPPCPERWAQKPARHFLYLGRIDRTAHRDYETLLRAFDRLAMEFPDSQLKLVGGGDLEGEIRNLLELLPHAAAHTELVGFSDPKPWLEWTDVLIHPSLVEGLSNTLLEGMAYGVTCIANDIPPNREALADGEAGILVPIKDVGALVQAMRRLATDPGECDRWRQRGRKRAEEVYSIDRIADEYLQLYAEVLKE